MRVGRVGVEVWRECEWVSVGKEEVKIRASMGMLGRE